MNKVKQPGDPNSVFLPETPSQTAGPFVHIGLALSIAGLPARAHEIGNRLASDTADGQHIELRGIVLDGNGQPVDDILAELWQAGADGVYPSNYRADNSFNGFGRAAPGAEDKDRWSFFTVKPGRVAHPDGTPMAPHVNLALFARGINIHLQTRAYFDDEDQANAQCPFLARVPAWRRDTLIARRQENNAAGEPVYEFVIRLQGEAETVFFDF